MPESNDLIKILNSKLNQTRNNLGLGNKFPYTGVTGVSSPMVAGVNIVPNKKGVITSQFAAGSASNSSGRFQEVFQYLIQDGVEGSEYNAGGGNSASRYGVEQVLDYDPYRKSKGLPQQSVKNITSAEASEIVYKNYWLKYGCPSYPVPLDAIFLDIHYLGTNRSVISFIRDNKNTTNPLEVAKQAIELQIKYLQSIPGSVKSGGWPANHNGWMNRLSHLKIFCGLV